MVFKLTPSSSKELIDNVAQTGIEETRALKSAAVYGANAAGKSNLLYAMSFLGSCIRNPMDETSEDEFSKKNIAFALDPKMAAKPSNFIVGFASGNKVYEYTVSLLDGNIESESLSVRPEGGKAQLWFVRVKSEIKFNQTYLKGPKKSLEQLMSPKHTLLSVAIAFGHNQLEVPARWLVNNLVDRFELGEPSIPFIGSRINRMRAVPSTAQRCDNDRVFYDWAKKIMCYADLGIGGFEIQKTSEKAMHSFFVTSPDGKTRTREFREVTTERHYPLFRHNGPEGLTALLGIADESQGTRRLFTMLSPLYDVLQNGQVALVDELGASMHPSLVQEIVKLFHNKEYNKLGSQLVFTTHNTSLLTGQLFRRDQVWFTEKTKEGSTDLYSLIEFKEAREGETFEKGYLRGRYGAIPFFGAFDFPATPEGVTE